MAAEARPSWRPFPVSHRSIPNLLVSASFSTTPVSYSVHLTDLANVWRESLDRKAILLRCLQENTSIDPSDDPENFKELLRWIEAAFDPDSPNHADTSLALSSTAALNSAAPADLLLEVTCILPAGFRPLKWPVRLKHGGPSALVADLVLPLVQAHLTRSQEVEALLGVIREKDGVISRVVDKLESTGARMEHVFSALVNTGKRKITRAVAEARVKGLAPFDAAGFKRKFRGGDGDGRDGEEEGRGNSRIKGPVAARDVKDLMDSVFEPALQRHPSLEYHEWPALDNWWNEIQEASGDKIRLVHRNRVSSSRKTPPPSERRPSGDDDDDDFEVQATPPHLLSARKAEQAKNHAPPIVDDESTDSGGEGETQIPDSNPPPRAVTTPTRPKKRMGTIGRRSEPEPEPQPDPEAETASEDEAAEAARSRSETAAKDGAGSETASDAEEPAVVEVSPPKPKPARGRMGRIGAAAKANAKSPTARAKDDRGSEKPPESSTTATAEEDDGPAAAKTRPARRMGKIGKAAAGMTQGAPKNEAADGDGDDDDGRRGRAVKARASEEPAAPPPP
ncbi:hypothetical protein MAPG_05033, partial [Magnaporthiopsis poae ATCC 64411]